MLHGFTPPHRFLHYLTWPEIARLPDREKVGPNPYRSVSAS
jgi:hypothetical protein